MWWSNDESLNVHWKNKPINDVISPTHMCPRDEGTLVTFIPKNKKVIFIEVIQFSIIWTNSWYLLITFALFFLFMNHAVVHLKDRWQGESAQQVLPKACSLVRFKLEVEVDGGDASNRQQWRVSQLWFSCIIILKRIRLVFIFKSLLCLF